jgi:hypothetical protein
LTLRAVESQGDQVPAMNGTANNLLKGGALMGGGGAKKGGGKKKAGKKR